MAKNIFQPMEIIDLSSRQKVQVAPPVFEQAVVELTEEDLGPSLEELKQQADEFKLSWAKEKERMIKEAHEEAQRIKEDAQREVEQLAQKNSDEIEQQRKSSEFEAEELITQAKTDAEQIIEEAKNNREKVVSDANSQGQEEGWNAGWQKGMEEVERLTHRLHVIVNAAIKKRKKFIEEAESQMIDLVLLISRKVIKVLSENQKKVVMQNVLASLKMIKNRADVTVRVNLADLKIVTKHKADFIRMVENVSGLAVLEDSSVDRGGAIVETDFGEIDARIQSQLSEIEAKIIELAPVKKQGDV